MTAAEDWANALDSWRIPEEILAGSDESPWTLPPKAFAEAARRALAQPPSPTHRRALEALPQGGTVLDVGSGAGAASLPLASRAKLILAVDQNPEMLDEMRAMGRFGPEVLTVRGTWPECFDQVQDADVAVCANVAYNVRALGPFVLALSQRSRKRVVLELTERHPQSPLNRLWLHFWNLERPTRPTAQDAARVIAEALGEEARSEHWTRAERGTTELDAERVAWLRRRLCLPPSREPEVESYIGHSAPEPPAQMVTLWWPGRA